MTGESGDVQFTMADGTSVGQIKIIVRKDDGVSHNCDITVSNWTDGSVDAHDSFRNWWCSNLYRSWFRGFINLHSISVVGTGSSVAGI